MNKLEFKLSPHPLDRGTSEEKATFGQFSVEVNDVVASEGVAFDSNELLLGPFVPAYHVADWLVRNWWRLAYEPLLDDDLENTTMEWDLAHWMSTIGEGYVWPNILLVSDGLRMTVKTAASHESGGKTFRYVGPDRTLVVALDQYKQAVQSLVTHVLELTSGELNTSKSDLHMSWEKLQADLNREKLSARRRIEAMLGFNPDEANPQKIEQIIEDTKKLGNDSVEELAADANTRRIDISKANDLKKDARSRGFGGNFGDAIEMESVETGQSWGECDAWRIGVATAHKVRQYAGLNGQPIDDAQLTEMAGTNEDVIRNTSKCSDRLSFVMKGKNGEFRIALRSKWETGRRFDVARLIADRLFDNGIDDPLMPATQAYTYRQKAQRAFAAEFLAPFDALNDFLNSDLTEDRRTEAAEYFSVSTYLINASIQNNQRLQ